MGYITKKPPKKQTCTDGYKIYKNEKIMLRDVMMIKK